MQLHYVIRKQVSQIDLQKDGTTIGIAVKDGVKTGSRPVIKAIKKGSIAYRSHCVSEKDVILSVCGVDARGMSRRDFKDLLREAESKIELKLEYQIREACLDRCGVYRMDRIVLKLKKESESFGFVLRKCGTTYPVNLGYPIISNIREGGPADRDGRLKSGDRLVQIDDQNLDLLSLSQVADILQAKSEATFTIEYKIALIENSQVRLGERTNLEINCPDADLGLVLGSSGSRMLIEEIHKGSLADRCGAFRIGDDILAINGVDVAFLSSAKANSSLRSFRKAPGRLVLVANTRRLTHLRQDIDLMEKKINPLVNEMLFQTPEPDQQVPSNNDLPLSCNSLPSLFDANLERNRPLVFEDDCYKFQIKTIIMLRELIDYIVSLEHFVCSSANDNKIDSVNHLNEVEINNNQDLTFQFEKVSHIKTLSARIKNSAYIMAMHLAKNKIFLSRSRENGAGANLNYSRDDSLNHEYTIQVLRKNLVEIYTKKLISKYHLEKLQLKTKQINLSCWKCTESCLLAVLTTQKILLIASLNAKCRSINFLIKKFTDDIFSILTCEYCIGCSVSQTGSDVLTDHINCSNPLRTKSSSSHSATKALRISMPPFGSEIPSKSVSRTGSESSRTIDRNNSSTHLEAKPSTSCSLEVKTLVSSIPPSEPRILRKTSDVNYLDPLHSKPSSSVTTSFSPLPRSPSSASVDGSLANVTISKVTCREAFSDRNCETKIHPNPYYKRHRTELETFDNSLAPPSIQSQNQSRIKAEQNGSLGFATPTVRMTICDSESIVGNCTPQSSVNTPNSSLSYQDEFLRVEDNKDYGKKSIGENYSGNIHKKALKGKGLLTAQRHSCKSSETIVDSESKSLKHAIPKIQKHSSEPQFLAVGYQTMSEKALNHSERDGHLCVTAEVFDANSETGNGNVDTNIYWSPFQKTDDNDHLNILDISNLSAKSSHNMKQNNHVSNERTTPCTMDVTLKNEGKGYGLSIEFLGSSSEDSNQVPCITVVNSQGAAHKSGILLRGDRVLAINGQNIVGLTVSEFEHLKEETFGTDEVALTVEFDVAVRDVELGTFDVCVTKTSKTGLIYNDFRNGSLVVKGIVKGSPAHRCGSLFPGDEVLFANNIRQELYDVSKNTYERSEIVIIRVRRKTLDEQFGNETNLEHDERPPFKTFDLSRTSIHSNHDSNKMFLEQELTLYRDPVSKDFGFLIGQNQDTKAVYITGIRPDGPADCSKVISKNDIILKINGVDLEMNKDEPIIHLFHPNDDRLELKTRRILNYE